MAGEVFLDAAYAIALASPKDTFHRQAIHLADLLQENRTQLVTTRAVVLEIGNALSRQRHRDAGVKLLRALESDSAVEIIALSEPLYAQAFQLYESRMDKEWGLTDCISFVVMQERSILAALTTDEHFQQAGFRALLREELK